MLLVLAGPIAGPSFAQTVTTTAPGPTLMPSGAVAPGAGILDPPVVPTSAPTPGEADAGSAASDAAGEDVTPETASETKPLPVGVRELGLGKVLEARQRIENDLRERQAALRSEAARGRESQIEAEIRALSEELSVLNRHFSELAAGVDPVSIDENPEPQELNLASEVRDLLGPLVNELKRATSRPREIDRLRTRISELGETLERVEGAIGRLDRTLERIRDAELARAIIEERRDWERRRGAISAALQVAQQKLDQRLGESQSIAQAVENLFQIFFKSRGRNLVLALVAMVAFVIGLRRLRLFIAERTPLSRHPSSFEGRVFSLVYSVFSVIGAILVFLISLYFFGDWVLLILVLLLILGLIWTSKQAIPRFWSQTVLMLDMGPVREGERVTWNGLPWHVDHISFYSTLSNPALVGGLVRLPIDDLGELRSRPWIDHEPWFPTQPGDVILLPDGRPAEVEFQSVEGVRVRTPGENRLILPAADFVSQGVEKLSGGYRVSITFGLDYGDQAEITTSMLDTMQQGIESRWRIGHWADSVVGISVEFKEAGPSSLDYFVRVDLDGSHAFDHAKQTRTLARDCVDICNENGWTIPFTQITLHMAGGQAQGADAPTDGPSS